MKKEKGITLIALVITIIVLLILAGVSIATLTGENGILTRANEAKTETEKVEEDELRRLTALEAATNLSNEDYYDVNEDKAVIPAGFAVSQVEGENVIDDGLVIIDSNGNEFVWVPVADFTEFRRYNFWNNTELSTDCTENSGDGETVDAQATESEREAQELYKSVKRNGGFYIGRYEAGTSSNDVRTSDSGIEDSIVVKQGANVYNYIKWGNSMIDETGGAVQKSREFAEENGYISVESTLIYGVQWDAIMRWIKDEPNLTGGKYVQDSTGMGWYSDNYEGGNPTHQIGIDLEGEKNKVKNIYDLAGNVIEWTMESFYNSYNFNSYKVNRGGNFDGNGVTNPCSARHNGHTPDSRYQNVGFRIAIYIK